MKGYILLAKNRSINSNYDFITMMRISLSKYSVLSKMIAIVQVSVVSLSFDVSVASVYPLLCDAMGSGRALMEVTR